ncbi:SDR family NAD(P)-dependent oxidoreductase [Acuticoccus sp. MNP-M23]|uniref:SDR family NAD(P)-dependent oxidoreductase n=1 Tax=Acuticoccus sp. MNP-M23 TaxID=3072793 RepID=UPI002815C84F|nr:SDR family NAD(P)-dependent oxidoreductase [Acuticoccus sp. MNP-M23]WMS43594.1 SDR family NAD(P)-dependent oxidoreductase [Acuticoccus sp. MNP-M23]
MTDLSTRTALVTGGNRGIGLEAVRALAAAGASVTFTARSAEKVDEAMAALSDVRDRVLGEVVDATDRAAVSALCGKGFDILVNNAGVVGPIGRIGDVAIADWAANIETNLVGAFHAIQQALPPMLARGGGTVVNLSSGAARNAMEGWSAYCAGKAGLAMLTRSVHLEFGDKGIRIFGFAPGVVDTDMQVSIRASGINPVSKLKREELAPAAEPAQAIAWLCTPAADGYCGEEVDVRDPELRAACGLPPQS